MRTRPPAQQPSPRSRGYIVLGIIFTLVAVGVWGYLNRSNIQEYTAAYRSREQAREKIAQTKQRIGQLKRQQQSLDANGVETVKRIRERLGMHMAGEKVYYLVNEAPTTATTQNMKKSPSTASESVQ